MKLATIIPVSYATSVVLTILGAYLKISHTEGALPLLVAGVIALVIFVASAIVEVNRSARLSATAKILWTVALVFFTSAAGLIYLLTRKTTVTPLNRSLSN